jgi:hypothetical protein
MFFSMPNASSELLKSRAIVVLSSDRIISRLHDGEIAISVILIGLFILLLRYSLRSLSMGFKPLANTISIAQCVIDCKYKKQKKIDNVKIMSKGDHSERIDEVIRLISEGISLRKALKEVKMAATTLYDALDRDSVRQKQYARAHVIASDMLAGDIIDVAESDINPHAARNIIDAKKWTASKSNPSKYGDKLDINLSTTVDITLALKESSARALPICYPSDTIEIQANDIKQVNTDDTTGCESVIDLDPKNETDPFD